MVEKALATFRNGKVQFDAVVDWPEGTRLEVGLPQQTWTRTNRHGRRLPNKKKHGWSG